MHVIPLGQSQAHSKHKENASYCEKLVVPWSIPHRMSSTVVVLCACITSVSLDEHVEVVFFAHWKIERSDRTCQKVKPRHVNGPLTFSLLTLQSWDAKRQLNIRSIFISFAQLANMSYPNMLNESNGSLSSLNSNNKKHEHLYSKARPLII